MKQHDINYSGVALGRRPKELTQERKELEAERKQKAKQRSEVEGVFGTGKRNGFRPCESQNKTDQRVLERNGVSNNDTPDAGDFLAFFKKGLCNANKVKKWP